MHKSNYLAFANIIQLLLDVLFLEVTFFVAYYLSSTMTYLNHISEYYWIPIIFLPFWISVMAFSSMYDKTSFYYFDRVLRNVIFASVFSGMILSSMFFFVRETATSRLFLMVFVILSIFILFGERWVASAYLRKKAPNASQIVVVCTKNTFLPFIRYLGQTQLRYNIVGVVQVGLEAIPDVIKLGQIEDLGKILRGHVVDEVFFTLPSGYLVGLEKPLNLCEQMGITARVVFNLYDGHNYRIRTSMIGTLPVLTFHTVSLNPLQQYAKRVLDIIGSLVGLTITALLSVFIIPAIKIDSPGPIIFKQRRVGLHGRIFHIYKFRSMYNNAESMRGELEEMNEHNSSLMFKIKDDPRVTKIGAFLRKTSMDELPQFFNVLRGEMSLVGTRPPTVDEYQKYDYEHMRRLSIKPGITGMWQINGRSSITDFDMVVALDTEYIDNWSVWMDLNIMLETIVKVCGMKSAY